MSKGIIHLFKAVHIQKQEPAPCPRLRVCLDSPALVQKKPPSHNAGQAVHLPCILFVFHIPVHQQGGHQNNEVQRQHRCTKLDLQMQDIMLNLTSHNDMMYSQHIIYPVRKINRRNRCHTQNKQDHAAKYHNAPK